MTVRLLRSLSAMRPAALGAGMDEAVAGAWIGASVDQTGNVLASAAIVGEHATEVAAIVKLILNSG